MPFASQRSEVMQLIIDAIPNPIFVKNRAHQIVLVNSSACALFGHSRETLLSRPDTELFLAKEVEVFHRADDLAFQTAGGETEYEEELTDSAGNLKHVLTRKRVTRLEGADYLIASVTDISATREAQARNRYLAFHDILTGLPNRALLKERIDEALQRRHHGCALIYIDLDRFKEVNDGYGHPAGDELIREFARRISEVVRAADTVARLGGDEFAILLTDTSQDPDAREVCRRTLIAAGKAFDIAGAKVQVNASIGVALTGMEAITETELQRRADGALYQAKHEGRGRFFVFTQSLDDRLASRLDLQAELREALAAGTGLEVHYQPIIGILSGQVDTYEALTRWRHPIRGLVMPDEFIPIAETSGMIVELDEWVLRRACSDAALWPSGLRLAVNISSVQFAFGNLAEMVERVLLQTSFDPTRLELEITESVLIHDPALALQVFRRLRTLGVRIVLDDFGTGYSSLSYFREFPFDKIKIDRSFVRDMLDNRHARSIVQAMISLARGLDLEVVAEGVESNQQLFELTKMGCTQAQGFLLGRPALRLLDAAPELTATPA